jgi:hypothetical protein
MQILHHFPSNQMQDAQDQLTILQEKRCLDCLQWSLLCGTQRHIYQSGGQNRAAALSGIPNGIIKDGIVIQHSQRMKGVCYGTWDRHRRFVHTKEAPPTPRGEKNEERKKGRGRKKTKIKKKIGEKEINCLFFINCVLEIILIKLLLGNWI